MKTVDFHSHILPGIDDGSKDVAMSLEMLQIMKDSGVDVACATSHFYGMRRSLDHFLERRAGAAEKLFNAISEKKKAEGEAFTLSGMQIMLGAEVAFYSGLTKENEVEKLCIGDTNTLLLEMPFQPWTDFEINEVGSLCFDHGLNVVIAHLERYTDFVPKEMLEQLMRLPVYVQINAEALLPWLKRGRWLKMFESGQAKLLGSDAHNLTNRAPNLAEGRDIIRKKLGAEALKKIDRCAQDLLKI